MKRILGYYNLALPLTVANKFSDLHYDPDAFIDWFLKMPVNEEVTSLRALPTKPKLLALWGYYFWIVYFVCSAFTFSISPWVAIVGILISPFVMVGGMYAVVYTVWIIQEPKRRAVQNSKSKQPGSSIKKSKKHQKKT